jgi:hypothetical protein
LAAARDAEAGQRDGPQDKNRKTMLKAPAGQSGHHATSRSAQGTARRVVAGLARAV